MIAYAHIKTIAANAERGTFVSGAISANRIKRKGSQSADQAGKARRNTDSDKSGIWAVRCVVVEQKGH